MSSVIINGSKLSGTLCPPPSKSDSHRAIICASLAHGTSYIHPISFSNDIISTINCMKILGANILEYKNGLLITGIDYNNNKIHSNYSIKLNCNESASTLRFIIPIVAALGINSTFLGNISLQNRTLAVYSELLPKHGVSLIKKGILSLPLNVSGKLQGKNFYIPANISSQFISGLLFALPILKNDTFIYITTNIESEPYLNMTIKTLNHFGIKIKKTKYGFFIKGNQSYISKDYHIERDWSQAAFFVAAGCIGSNIHLKGMDINSNQGDKEIINIAKQFGADISIKDKDIFINTNQLKGINVDVSQIPDLVPIIAVIASNANGTSRIFNASRLRLKESDRLKSISKSLKSIGASIIQTSDSIVINGVKHFNSSTIDSFNDHRIAMAMSIAAIKTKQLTIKNFHCINKSYPNFFNDYNMLGGNIHVVNLGK